MLAISLLTEAAVTYMGVLEQHPRATPRSRAVGSRRPSEPPVAFTAAPASAPRVRRRPFAFSAALPSAAESHTPGGPSHG